MRHWVRVRIRTIHFRYSGDHIRFTQSREPMATEMGSHRTIFHDSSRKYVAEVHSTSVSLLLLKEAWLHEEAA